MFDATNTTRERRDLILNFAKENAFKVAILYLTWSCCTKGHYCSLGQELSSVGSGQSSQLSEIYFLAVFVGVFCGVRLRRSRSHCCQYPGAYRVFQAELAVPAVGARCKVTGCASLRECLALTFHLGTKQLRFAGL